MQDCEDFQAWVKMFVFHIWLVLLTAFVWFVQESQQQKEIVEQRYVKYKEIVQNLQHQLDESKHRIQEYRVCHTNTLFCTRERT